MIRLWDAPVLTAGPALGRVSGATITAGEVADWVRGFAAAVAEAKDDAHRARRGDRRRRPRHQHGPRHAGGGARSSTPPSRGRAVPDEGRRDDADLQGRRCRRARSTGRSSCSSGRRPAPDGMTPEDWAACLDAGVAGVQSRGKAEPGDKTMVDALLPAARRTARGARPTEPRSAEALDRAADAAEEGARATIPLVARKGRASYLGERSAGHQDPGATSSALLVRCAARDLGRSRPRGGRATWRPVRRGDRPGDDQHALHDLRPGRQRRRDLPEGARADLSQAGLGGARPGGGLEPHRGGRRRAPSRMPASARTSSPRSASPTSARRPWCGTATRVRPSTTRSSGRTRAPTASATS